MDKVFAFNRKALQAQLFFLSIILTVVGIFLPSIGFASLSCKSFYQDAVGSSVPYYKIKYSEFRHRLGEKVNAVIEFKKIGEMAKNFGLEVYLYGESASSFLHHVKWDIAQDQGIIPKSKFFGAYNLNDIYSQKQRVDLILVGTDSNRKLFIKSLEEFFKLKTRQNYKFNFLSENDVEQIESQGPQTQYSLLKYPIYEKSSPDLNTNLVRDIFENRINFVSDPSLTSYSPVEKLKSALKLLLEISRADLSINEKTTVEVKKIVDEFTFFIRNNHADLADLGEIFSRLILESKNFEKIFGLIKSVGLESLTDKIGLDEESIRLLRKKPLISAPLGKGTRTARGLGLNILAHETSSQETYLSMISNPTGLPNVFESSNYRYGEEAVYGDGFYTAAGEKGIYNKSPYHIKFEINPDAIEGIDFKLIRAPRGGIRQVGRKLVAQKIDYVLILNRNAIRVINEVEMPNIHELFEEVLRDSAPSARSHLNEAILSRKFALGLVLDSIGNMLRSPEHRELFKGIKLIISLADQSSTLHRAVNFTDSDLTRFIEGNLPIIQGGIHQMNNEEKNDLAKNISILDIYRNSKELSHVILENELPVDINIGFLDSILTVSAANQDLTTLRKLIQIREVDINYGFSWHPSALQSAIHHQNVEMLKLLLTRKDLNLLKTMANGKTPISYAIELRNKTIISLLLEAGVNLSLKQRFLLFIQK